MLRGQPDGQPYLPPDRESAHAKRVIAQVERGLNEATLADPPDLHPRPLPGWVSASAELRDTAHYRSSGEDIDAVLIELQGTRRDRYRPVSAAGE